MMSWSKWLGDALTIAALLPCIIYCLCAIWYCIKMQSHDPNRTHPKTELR